MWDSQHHNRFQSNVTRLKVKKMYKMFEHFTCWRSPKYAAQRGCQTGTYVGPMHTHLSCERSLTWTHARYRFKWHNKIELTNFVTIIKMMCSIWVNDVLFDLSSIIEYHGNNIFNITTINSISSFNTVNWALSSIRLFVILCLRHYLFWDLWVYSTIPRN